MLVVAFPVRFTDGPGADLVVHEVGPSAEPTELAVSADGVTWIAVGRIEGAVREVDLAKTSAAGGSFTHVRLTAVSTAGRGPWAGPDLDAVGALHTCAADRLRT